MKYPNLGKNQFAVGTAKLATGHVLKKDGSYFLAGDEISEIYEVFDSYEEAKKIVVDRVSEKSEIECWIIDSEGKHLFTYDRNGERKFSKSI